MLNICASELNTINVALRSLISIEVEKAAAQDCVDFFPGELVSDACTRQGCLLQLYSTLANDFLHDFLLFLLDYYLLLLQELLLLLR